ncbi:MAG TPA: TAT-variant-translocated molybdopterin oxidoreductase [Acidobacteriaceae bacterium]|nr:TAT-variant-translocated molybdopterin oxidoreductase [Acidobacteriaceae bacterium]
MAKETGIATVETKQSEAPQLLESTRVKLAGATGKQYWRSVDELAGTPEFEQALLREFPQHASEWVDPVSRRGFLKLMGASLALAGLTGCTKQPEEPIYPYVKQPEDLVLGKPVYFATAHPFPMGSVPLLVKSDAYRPIKVDGNPEHPMNHGTTDAYTQGTLLGLYDPDRSQRVLYRGETRTYPNFMADFRAMLAEKRASGGQGLYILSGTVVSPTLAEQWKKAQQSFPNAKWAQYDPINRDSSRTASKAAFGEYVDAQYKLDVADVVVSLDADFLSGLWHPGFLKLAGDYSRRRKLNPDVTMNRLYAVESTPSTTGFKADNRLGLRASQVEGFAAALAAAVGAGSAPSGYTWTDAQTAFLNAAAKDLKANAGKSVVIPGEQASPAVHMAAIAINQALGNAGKTVIYTETIMPMPTEQTAELKQLVDDLNAGKVDWLVILDGNPVYAAPGDLEFEKALGHAKTVVHQGLYVDETAQVADWHINASHYLEYWSDVRAYDGTVSIVQPMIDPLYNGKSAHDIIQSMLDDPDIGGYGAVQETWKPILSTKGDYDFQWRKALHDGWIADTAFPPKSAAAKTGSFPAAPAPDVTALEVIFRPDPTLYDGRYANLGWMQELPKPITNLSWDNAALMSMQTMSSLQVIEGGIIEIAYQGRTIKAPALVVPGHPDQSISLYLGSGRRNSGRVGTGQGFDVAPIRVSATPLFYTGATAKNTGDVYEFAIPKSHYIDDRDAFARSYGNIEKANALKIGSGPTSLEGDEAEGRGIIRYATLEEFRKNPNFANEGEEYATPAKDFSLFPGDWKYEKNAWALVIDMNSCVGCNACIISCYAENNIAVVGKQEVKIGRDMQWIRIDTYFEGDLNAPKAHFQPMTCQQCENAPCEQVCPVGATVHTPEGLNAMVYNRCVGTRYCSNNCPYKVRRFNWLLFSDYETESLKLMRNPDVTVRSRGVMEKCTYCVQRISAAKIRADKENRDVRDGEIVTACQQACPTQAITFGNKNDKNSRVSKLRAQTRNYSVLADLNTRPRTTYIAGVINPSPDLTENA